MAGKFSSADQLVQNLKQNRLSPDQKIDLAIEVLNNPAGITLPNHEEFLLEWCIQQLVRSAKLDDSKSAGAPYLNPKYYQLLIKLIPGSMSTHFIKATISHLPFVPVITRMLDYIVADMAMDTSDVAELRSALVTLAFQTLVQGSPYMESINQDWLVKLLLANFSLIHLAEGNLEESVLDLLAIPLADLIKMFKWSAQYKKVFSTTVDQLLLPVSRCRYLLKPLCPNNPKAKQVTELLEELLSFGLFHPTHVTDYANLVSNPTASFYRKQLFKNLKAHLAANPGPILDLMAVLFRLFMAQYPRTGAAKIDFDFSWALVDIVGEYLESKPADTDARVFAIEAISEILDAIHRHTIYVPSNDQASQSQLLRLGKAYTLLKGLWGSGGLKSPLLRGYCALVSIDYCLVDEDVRWLWEKAASPEAEDLASASSLGLALLQEYGKARQLERCFRAMVAVLDNAADFTQTLLCHESFATGFCSILGQLGSAVQASHLLGIVVSSVCPSSDPHIGSILILAHLIRGLPSSSLPLAPLELEQAIVELGSRVFGMATDGDLAAELSSLSVELQQPLAASNSPAFEAMAALHLFANIQDRWSKPFLSEAALCQIVAWCRKHRSQLPSAASLALSWELPVSRLLLQHLEAVARAAASSTDSVRAYFKLILLFLEHSAPPARDGILYTLLGPYLPFVGELMHPDEKKTLVQALLSEILGRPSPFVQILANARFYEVASLRKFVLGDLFDRLILCFPEGAEAQPSGQQLPSPSAIDQVRFDRLQHILSMVQQSGRGIDQTQLDLLQRILLLFTHIPTSYLSPNHRAIILTAIRVHQELIASPERMSPLLQAGWEVNLALVCTLMTSDFALIRQKQGQGPYVLWLLDTVSSLLAKLSAQTHLLTDQLTHVVGSGLLLSLSHNVEDEADVSRIFADLNFSLDIAPETVIKYEILSQTIRRFASNPKHCEKLRLKNIPLFQAATLREHWQSLEKLALGLSCQASAPELRTALALSSLFSASAIVCPSFTWPENHQCVLSKLLAQCHQFLKAAPLTSGAAAILEGGIELHCAIVSSFPACHIPKARLLPLLASFVALCKRVSSLSSDASFADLSTETLRRTASEFLARVDSSQWSAVLSALFEQLLGLPAGEDSRPSFLVLTLFLGDTSESFRKVLASSLAQVIQNLVQLLILKPEQRKHTLAMIVDIVRRPDFHLPPSTLGTLLSCIENLPAGDTDSENRLGQILALAMKGHVTSLSSNIPTLVSALVRVAQTQTVDMGIVLQSLPSSKEVPGIQHHVQYLLLRLINMHQPTPNDSAVFTGWFHCFDTLQPTSPESLLGWLDPTRQYLLKRAHQEYISHHKFTGKV